MYLSIKILREAGACSHSFPMIRKLFGSGRFKITKAAINKAVKATCCNHPAAKNNPDGYPLVNYRWLANRGFLTEANYRRFSKFEDAEGSPAARRRKILELMAKQKGVDRFPETFDSWRPKKPKAKAKAGPKKPRSAKR